MDSDLCQARGKPNGWLVHVWLAFRFCSHECARIFAAERRDDAEHNSERYTSKSERDQQIEELVEKIAKMPKPRHREALSGLPLQGGSRESSTAGQGHDRTETPLLRT